MTMCFKSPFFLLRVARTTVDTVYNNVIITLKYVCFLITQKY